MTKPAISVRGLWKEYQIGGMRPAGETFYDVLANALRRPFRRGDEKSESGATDEKFWALRDINFDIQPGEVVGVIGRNGAGKSTLLKVLSRITAPTRGRVEVRGRLSSLLEVGTGFHPELSGRENIYLNGAILGMARTEVTRKFDEIVAFAEIDKFVDTPVKRYSSGMYVRLAFSVAAHLEPDILIVDEVLAVGDAEFQHKCIGKLDEVRSDGRTVVVVSHNIAQLGKLCREAVWLEQGRVLSHGSFGDVSANYLKRDRQVAAVWVPTSALHPCFRYERVSILAGEVEGTGLVPASTPITIQFRFSILETGLSARIALQIVDTQGLVVLSSANTDAGASVRQSWRVGQHELRCTIPANLLSPGTYALNISQPHKDKPDEVIENVCSFGVDSADSLRARDGRAGVICPLLVWQHCP